MIRNRLLLRSFTVFLVLEMLFSLFGPGISWALTSGPTAPEATSFEPVDTTDMVNLITGDFVYNLPLLEVPGPSGGYPLSLSYHSGIKLEQDASWVGLGWTLNPGAINRSVNGFADDNQGVSNIDRSFWEGGESKQMSIGIGVGIAGMASVNAGLIFAEDTYKGVGTGYYYGARAGLGPVSVNHQGVVSPYGDHYSSTGVSVGIGMSTQVGISASASVGVSIDQDGKTTGSISGGINQLGVTMSSGGVSNFSVGGFSAGVHNSKAGNVSTSGYNFSLDIPLKFINIKFSKSYQRYWIDETADIATYGALYFPTTEPSSSELDSKSFDVYDLQYPYYHVNYAPDEALAGAFIDYDHYTVLGQGIGGTIKPYHYQSYLVRQNKLDGSTYRVKSYPIGINPKPHFRFVGDFSNRFEHDINTNAFISNSSTPLSFTFSGDRHTGENGIEGYDAGLNILPGSRHVEWFTNTQINDNSRTDGSGNPLPPGPEAAVNKRFVNCKALGFEREDNDQIGGFMITNESGMTFHYALPVYSFDEYQYTGRLDEQGKHHFNLYKKPEAYAYTWLLTAVTGPDFVDVNFNGYADEEDYGHWVNFSYGKWSYAYSWRNPSSGFNKDVDHSFDTFSKGKKEVYYLNAIATKTHTAFFVKELRADGKGIVHKLTGAIDTNGDHEVEDIDDGSYEPVEKPDRDLTYLDYPVSALRLQSIYLIQNEYLSGDVVEELSSYGEVYYHRPSRAAPGKHTFGDYVIDVHDMDGSSIGTTIQTNCLRKIGFHVDYSLTPETPNSFWSELDVLNTANPAVSSRLGKLTLKSVSFHGRGETKLVPDVGFSYDGEKEFYATKSEIGDDSYTLSIFGAFEDYQFRKGDILYSDDGIGKSYAFVTDVLPGQHQIQIRYFYGLDHVPDPSLREKFVITKNPPYVTGAYDLWGNYKVDSPDDIVQGTAHTENIRRMTTSVSARSADVWSLREIRTSLGAGISMEYEPDVYRSALKSLANIPIKSIEPVSGGKTRIVLYENVAEYGLKGGDEINMRWLTAIRYDVKNPILNTDYRFNCNDGPDDTSIFQWYYDGTYSDYTATVESPQDNSFVVAHNFRNRYPDMTSTATCFKEDAPYTEQDHTINSQHTGYDCIRMVNLVASEPIFLGGEIVTTRLFSPFGGDVRVRKLSISTFAEKRSTNYEYFNGITPYEPLGISIPVSRITNNLSSCLRENQEDEFASFRAVSFGDIYNRFKVLFASSRELPGPGVFYEWVRVSESIETPEGITELKGRSEFQFQVFSPETIDISTPGGVFLSNPMYSGVNSMTNFGGTVLLNNDPTDDPVLGLPIESVRSTNDGSKPSVRDFSGIMGSLKRIVYYDEFDRKVNETINHYLHDDFNVNNYLIALSTHYNSQGLVTETFADARIILDEPDIYTLHGVVSQKIRYPSIQTGQTSINYKTGISTSSETLEFDYYSGSPVKTRHQDGYGQIYISETMPAYHHYPGMGFGYLGNRNMLSQSAGSTIYKVDEFDVKYIVSAEASTWSKGIPMALNGVTTMSDPSAYEVWRPLASYTWKGDDAELSDGLYPGHSFSQFNHENPILNSAQWEKLSEVNLMDKYSNVLEVSDVNGLFAAKKMSSDQVFVLASAVNAGYDDFAYSGAEDDLLQDMFGGGVSASNQLVVNDKDFAHTGHKSLQIAPDSKGFSYEVATENLKSTSRRYHASVWVKERQENVIPSVSLIAETDNNVSLGAVVPLARYKANGWYLIQLDFDVPESGLMKVYIKNESQNDVYYADDFRVHPLNSVVTSYVYNKYGELSHILDGNNMFTEYRYDDIGRLIETVKESFQYNNSPVGRVTYYSGME